MTHPVFLIPSLQCAVCGYLMDWENLKVPKPEDETAAAWCKHCDKHVLVPLILAKCIEAERI